MADMNSKIQKDGTTDCPSCSSDNWKTAKLVVLENTYCSPGQSNAQQILYGDQWFDTEQDLNLGESSSALAYEVKKLMHGYSDLTLPHQKPNKQVISLPPKIEPPKLAIQTPEKPIPPTMHESIEEPPKKPIEPALPRFTTPPREPNDDIDNDITSREIELNIFKDNGPHKKVFYDYFFSYTALTFYKFSFFVLIVLVYLSYAKDFSIALSTLSETLNEYKVYGSIACLSFGFLGIFTGPKDDRKEWEVEIEDMEKKILELKNDKKEQRGKYKSTLSQYEYKCNKIQSEYNGELDNYRSNLEQYKIRLNSYKEFQLKAKELHKNNITLFETDIENYKNKLVEYDNKKSEHSKELELHNHKVNAYNLQVVKQQSLADHQYEKDLEEYKKEINNCRKFKELLWDNARVCSRCGYAYIGAHEKSTV